MQVLFDLRIQGIGLNVPITFADYPITRSLEGIKDCWNVGKQIEYTLFLDNWYYFTLAYPDVHCPCVLEKSVTNWKVVISTILMTFHKKVVVFQKSKRSCWWIFAKCTTFSNCAQVAQNCARVVLWFSVSLCLVPLKSNAQQKNDTKMTILTKFERFWQN
jgi:hypothetical protein